MALALVSFLSAQQIYVYYGTGLYRTQWALFAKRIDNNKEMTRKIVND